MASLQNIQRKISSIKSTQKITKAMKMVAAAKLKRAQDRIISARPYAEGMASVLKDLSQRVNRERYPLLLDRKSSRVELVVVTADRGLCGGFNANILRAAQSFMKEQKDLGKEVSLTLVGRKARDFFQRRNIPSRRIWIQVFDRLDYSHAAEIGKDLVQAYLNKIIEHDQRTFSDLRRKNFIFLSGGASEQELISFRSFTEGFKQSAESKYLGGKGVIVAKNNNSAVELINISEEVNDGVMMVNFFGHSL